MKIKNIYSQKKDLEKINKDMNKSKDITNKNFSLIKKQIDLFKLQLKDLENLYNEYKDMNEKLVSLSKYILEKYKNEFESKNPFYFFINFN